MWNINFDHIDFEEIFRKYRGAQGIREEKQYVLPFIENVRQQDVTILHVAARRPNALELRVRIRFAS